MLRRARIQIFLFLGAICFVAAVVAPNPLFGCISVVTMLLLGLVAVGIMEEEL